MSAAYLELKGAEFTVDRIVDEESVHLELGRLKCGEGSVCTEEDVAKVDEIITALGTRSKIILLFRRGYYEKLGRDIEHLHPLKFLEIIFTNGRLVDHVRNFRLDRFKWDHFIGNLSASLFDEIESIRRLFEDFAKVLSVSYDDLRIFLPEEGVVLSKRERLADKRWERMFDFLLRISLTHEPHI